MLPACRLLNRLISIGGARRLRREQTVARHATIFGLIGTGLLIGSCGQPGLITKTHSLGKTKLVTTGARQRVIAVHNPGFLTRTGLVHPKRIVCTEPSPDVAVAIARSSAASASILAKAARGAAAISRSAAEGLVQLAERTVTIQLIREQMFRACEGYANGALTSTSYTLLLNRLNDAMISLVSAEVAAGAFGRRLAALGGKAASEARAAASLSGVVKDIDEAAKKLAAAEKKVKDADQKVTRAELAVQKADDGQPAESETERAAAKQLKTAKRERDDAVRERDALLELLRTNIKAAAKSSAEISTVAAGGGIEATTSPQLAAEIAKIQKQFLQRDTISGYVSACLVELGLGGEDRASKLAGLSLRANAGETQENRKTKGNTEWKEFREAILRGGTNAKGKFETFVWLSNLSRKSGLYRHCQKNLRDALIIGHHDSFVRQREATGRLMVNYTEALRRCRIVANSSPQLEFYDHTNTKRETSTFPTDPWLFRRCVAGVEAIRLQVARVTPPRETAVRVPPSSGGAGPLDPTTVVYAIVETRFNELAALQTKVGKLNVPQGQDRLDKRRKAANKDFTALSGRKGALISNVRKGELQKIEADRNSILTELRLAKTADERRIGRTKLSLNRQLTNRERTKYHDLLKAINAMLRRFNRLLRDFAQAGSSPN